MRASADVRRRLHDTYFVRALHAPQRTDERRERPAFRRCDRVEIRVWVGPGGARLLSGEVAQEASPRACATAMVRGCVDVHVLGARGKGAQVVREVLEWACLVCAEEPLDVLEARERTVPFLLGWVFACAVEEHAEAARRAGLLCGGRDNENRIEEA
jgi:hypothetical protein